MSVLRSDLERWRVSLFGDRIHVIVDGDAARAARDLRARLERASIRTLDATEQDYSLEDVFIVIVERNHRASRAGAAA
jgi:ABC-2 type transport system ATP-binding protein